MDEFWKAAASIQWPKITAIEYRIYYDLDTGRILDYSTDDRPGNYIVVDRHTFAQHRFEPLIRDGALIWPKTKAHKLVPADSGVACHPDDVTIICSGPSAVHWKMKVYEN